jgi:hypothetical protein
VYCETWFILGRFILANLSKAKKAKSTKTHKNVKSHPLRTIKRKEPEHGPSKERTAAAPPHSQRDPPRHQGPKVFDLRQCSKCTAAVCTTAKLPLCSRCHTSAAFTCSRCLVDCILPVTTCLGCTPRPHICLSSCLRRCMRATGPAPTCRCGVESKR